MLAPRHTADTVADYLLVMKVWLIMGGIFIWEFFTTLDYEWSVIRGHQRYRWSIWIYSISRVSCLTVVVLALANYSLRSEISCQAWITICWTFSSLGCFGLSSILIILRIFAIWDRNRIVMGISAALWLINIGFQLEGIIKIRSVWAHSASSCVITNIEIIRGLTITSVTSDIVLLLIMLAGLLRLRIRSKAFLDLARVLWTQGVIWLLIATIAELPQALLLLLNINTSFDVLFTLPSMITIVIAASRTYRALTNYVSTPPSMSYGSGPDSSTLQKNNRMALSSIKQHAPISFVPNRLEVTVHKTCEEYPMSQMNHCGSYPSSASSAAHLPDKPPHELGLDENVEGSQRKERINQILDPLLGHDWILRD